MWVVQNYGKRGVFMGKEQKDSGRAMGIVAFFTLFMAIMTFNLIVFPACALSTMEVLGVGAGGD